MMRSLALLLLCLGWAMQVTAIEIMWPTEPAVGASPSLRWDGGTAPYTMNVHNMNTSMITYTYTGNDNFTFWTVDVPAGTVVTFQVTDTTGATVTSDPVTVLPNPLSSSISESSVSVARLSSLSMSLLSASLASVASVSSISVTSVGTSSATSTDKVNPGSTVSPGASPTGPSHSGGGSNHTGAIVGGVVGILGAVVLALGGFCFIMRRRRKYSSVPPQESDSEDGQPQMAQLGVGDPHTPPSSSVSSPGFRAGSDQDFTPTSSAPPPLSQQQQNVQAQPRLPQPPQQQQMPLAGGTHQQSRGVLPPSNGLPAQDRNFNDDRRGWSGLPEL